MDFSGKRVRQLIVNSFQLPIILTLILKVPLVPEPAEFHYGFHYVISINKTM